MKRNYFVFLLLGLCVLSFAFIYGCGANPTGDGSNPSPSETSGRVYYGTQSPGDAWSWDIGSSTFTGTNLTRGWTISGSYITLNSLFKEAAVTGVGTSGITAGSKAYFLEFPNTMLLVKPAESSDNVIVCAASAASAPTEECYSYITIPSSGWDYTSYPAFGTVEATLGSTYTFEVFSHLLDGTAQLPTTESNYTFSGGKFSRADSNFQIFVTPSGVFVADNGPNNGGIAGAASYTTFTSEAVIGKQFRGVLFKYYPGTQTGETEPIGATGEANGTVRGGSFLFERTLASSEPNYTNGPTLEFGASIANGVYSGTMHTTNFAPTPFALIMAPVGNPQKMMVFGISTQEGSGIPYNFLVIEQ